MPTRNQGSTSESRNSAAWPCSRRLNAAVISVHTRRGASIDGRLVGLGSRPTENVAELLRLSVPGWN
jgi:hypothetical protein